MSAQPTVGRIVHVMIPGVAVPESRIDVPAIVTASFNEVISVTLFPPSAMPQPMSGVLHDESGGMFTWHWPEIVPS